MEKERLEALLIDYIDGKLSEGERRIVEQEYLLRDKDSYKLYEQLKEVMHVMHKSSQLEPTAKLRSGFDKALQSEIGQNHRGRTIYFSPVFYRAAAAVTLLAVAGVIGFWINQQRQHAAELSRVREEVLVTKKAMMALLNDQNSASQRLVGATVAFNDIAHADADIIKALVRTMNEDENSNVRLAAIEALVKFNDEPHVRQALISALGTQKDPVVQITLIRLLVDMRAQGLKKQLEQITTDDELLPAVKDEAHAGLLKLS
ncbi:MAG TPA: HEAT repeat domain-containing protein [Chryseolinea sp.]|nr:HEAT repeat domain-containing protein [Chryseolinea sp.]